MRKKLFKFDVDQESASHGASAISKPAGSVSLRYRASDEEVQRELSKIGVQVTLSGLHGDHIAWSDTLTTHGIKVSCAVTRWDHSETIRLRARLTVKEASALELLV